MVAVTSRQDGTVAAYKAAELPNTKTALRVMYIHTNEINSISSLMMKINWLVYLTYV
jgi:hypothetical protein